MYYDETFEEILLQRLKDDPDGFIIFPDNAYNSKGDILISVNYLRKTLLRHLYEKVRGPLSSREFLHQITGPKGNQNPYHYTVSRISNPALRNQCRNGHPKLEGKRCEVCYEAALAKKRKGGLSQAQKNALKQFCPQGHPYNNENTRVITDKKTNKTRRQCRTCEKQYRERKRGTTK